MGKKMTTSSEEFGAKGCLKNGQRCLSDRMCCATSICREVSDGFRACAPSVEGLKVGENCREDKDCVGGYCKKLSCESLTYVGIDQTMCDRIGVCAVRDNSLALPADFR